jgi:menaquinone-9 beta-reductase
VNEDADVVISGGSLAGCATAIALAQRGISTVIVERAEFPRDKPCGEGLLPHGVEQLEALGVADVLASCDAQPFRGILYRCGPVVAPGDFEGGQLGRGVRRRALDAALQERAKGAGVRFVRAAVARAIVDETHATLELADGAKVRGRVAVGADGPRSIVRHTLGLDGGPPRAPRYALRQHFTLAAGAPMPDRVEVNALEGFELYLTPVAARTVGVAALCEKPTMEAAHGKPAERLRALIETSKSLQARLEGAEPASDALACGPLRVRVRDVASGRAVLVGDAAGYVDAITGEGMSLALKTARMCASAIGAVLDGEAPTLAFSRYRAQRAAVFRDHALLTFGLVEVARRPWLARRTIARLARDPALFSRLLAVNNGTRGFFELSMLDFAKLGLGASPARFRPLADAATAPGAE